VNFGLNIGLEAPVGDVFTDQKLPGVHMVLGSSFPEVTGARWDSPSWIGLTSAGQVDVDIDKTPILRGGRYIL
jgi:hypothetical protein